MNFSKLIDYNSKNIKQTDDWIYFNFDNNLPTHGWKIHITIIPSQFSSALKRIYSYCSKRNIAFKIPSTFKQIERLTYGGVPFVQNGKVFTLYISNPSSLKQHLEELDAITHDLNGPIVPTDKKFNNVIYYRYGCFHDQSDFDRISGIKYYYYYLNGERVLDTRKPNNYKPSNVEDPIEHKEQTIDNEFAKRNINIKRCLVQKAKGGVYLISIDNKAYIMKEARPFVLHKNGKDAKDRLYNEYKILSYLDNHVNYVPKVIDYFSFNNNSYLIIEKLDGEDFSDFMDNELLLRQTSPKKLLSIIETIHSQLLQLHKLGVIIRDLSPGNIILDSDSIRFIDFETAYFKGENNIFSGYTPGFVPNQSISHFRTEPEYDLYALGAMCLMLSTGLSSKNIHKNSFTEFQDNIGISIEHIKKNGTEILCKKGIEFINPLAILLNEKPLELSSFQSNIRLKDKNYFKEKYSLMISDLDHDFHHNKLKLNKSAQNFHPYSLNYGYGSIPFLSNSNLSQQYINRWNQYNQNEKYDHPGLYFGDSIMIYNQLIHYGNCDEVKYLFKNKIERFGENDNSISHGRAGLGLLLLKSYYFTQDKFYLELAFDLKDSILNAVKIDEFKNIYWLYESFDTINKKVHKFIGFSHGLVGIGYFLSELYFLKDDEVIKRTVDLITETLNNLKLSKNGNYYWFNKYSPEGYVWPHWCNGTSGILLYLHSIYKSTKSSIVKELFNKSLRGLLQSDKYDTNSLCHGIAGHTKVLLFISKGNREIIQAELQDEVDEKIEHNLSLLESQSVIGEAGYPTWVLEDDKTISFSYMTGYLGPYSTFALYHDENTFDNIYI